MWNIDSTLTNKGIHVTLLTYAFQVRCPQSVKVIENIENVQKGPTKFILDLGFMTNIPYDCIYLYL